MTGNRIGNISVGLLLLLILSCTTAPEKKWYRGNLHTHSYWSDGNDFPEMIMKWYKEHDYDFVALSDHNILAEGDKWISFKKGSDADTALKAYRQAFGESWVDYSERKDSISVKLKTLQEYRTLFEEPDSFLVIKSEEITDGFQNKPIHVNATNIQNQIEPQGGSSVSEVMQNNIDAVNEQRQETGIPMFPHINHPNFGWAVTAEDLKKLEGERFFEVYNGHPLVNNYGDSLRSGTEKMWDEVNTYYLQHGKLPMYGIAVDDAHHYHQFNNTKANPGRGWIQVQASELSADSLIASMERGDFYASSGVRLMAIRYENRTLSIEIEAEPGIAYTTEFIGTKADSVTESGKLLKRQSGNFVSYHFTGDELYVRAKIISNKRKANPYAKGEMEVAWTQPVVIDN